jgi:hypothetical protein
MTDTTAPAGQAQSAPTEPRTAWDVVKAFLTRLAEAEPAVTVEQATAELVAQLDTHRLLRTERDQARILAAEKAAWVLGRVPDYGEEANRAGRVAHAQWRQLVPEVAFELLALAMTEGGYARLVAADAAGRQRMWDSVTRAVPGPHQAQLGPLEDEAVRPGPLMPPLESEDTTYRLQVPQTVLPEPYASAPQAENIARTYEALQAPPPLEQGEPL